MNGATKHVLALLAIGTLILFLNLGVPRLWDRDEPRNAGCAVEMLARGDWVVPWFNDELRTHKPVLLYWLIMTAYSVLGVNEFSARFGSALLGLGTVLWTYVIGRRLFSPRVGLLAGTVLASTLMFDVAARAATPDSTLIFFVTASIGAFVVGTFPARKSIAASCLESSDAEPQVAGVLVASSWRLPFPGALGVYLMMGMAVLAKGPVGVVLPVAILGLFVAIASCPRGDGAQRIPSWLNAILRVASPMHLTRSALKLRPLLAVAVVLLVAAPWYLAVGYRTDGEFLRGFFWDHNVSRAMESREGHGGGWWFYPLAMLAGFFPWSVFALPVGLTVVRACRRSDAHAARLPLALLLSWCTVWVGAFSLAGTKLPSYVTPCYPALAVLVAFVLVEWIERAKEISTAWIVAAFGVLSLVGLILAGVLPRVAARYLPGEAWLGSFGLILSVGGVVAGLLARRDYRAAAVLTCSASSVAFVACFFGVGTVAVDRHQENHRLIAALPSSDRPAAVYHFGTLEPSWVFYSGRFIREVVLETPVRSPEGRPVARAEAAVHHDRPDLDFADQDIADQKTANRHKPSEYVRRPMTFEALLRQDTETYLITTRRKLDELPAAYRDEFVTVTRAPLFLKPEELVLLRRASQDAPPVARRFEMQR